MQRAPREFAIKTVLFFLPLLAVLVAIGGVVWRTGETWPTSKVVRMQSEHPERIFLRGVLDQGFYRYKFFALNDRRADVVVLGSSRMMKFRHEMFGTDSFYNAGGLIQSSNDLRWWADTTTWLPRVMLVGIDMWWLNPNFSYEPRTLPQAWDERTGDWKSHLAAIRGSILRPELLEPLLRSDPSAIGLGARTSGRGFRGDGSLRSGLTPPREFHYRDRENPTVPDRIRRGVGQFPFADSIDGKKWIELTNTLLMLRSHGTEIIVILPPFSTEAITALMNTPRQREFYPLFRRQLTTWLEQHRFIYLDASDPRDLGLDDRYFTDGYHAEETLHLHLLARLLARDTVRMMLPNASTAVNRALQSPRTNYWYADFE